jgi:hypothetical protein
MEPQYGYEGLSMTLMSALAGHGRGPNHTYMSRQEL